jgi:transglutaminase-like putative cysteine protease
MSGERRLNGASSTRGVAEPASDRGWWPAEGWTTLLAVALMMVAVAFAIDDALWAGYIAGTSVTQTSFLIPGAILSVLVGFALAESRLSRLAAHALGAVLGAGYLLVSVAGTVSSASSVEQRLRDLNASLATFFHEVVELGIRSAETSVFLLLIGAVVWSAGQFAAFAIFRDRRPIPAIAIASLLLITNMSITVRDQLLHLVVMAAAALFIVVRMNLLEQMRSWRSRHIADTGRVAALFVRTGAVFVAIAVTGSIVLAANASSAPLARAWRDLDQKLIEIGYEVNRWIGGVSGPARGPSNLFSPVQTIRDVWETSTDPVMLALTSDGQGYYWRGATFDAFDGRSWQQLEVGAQRVNAFDNLLANSVENPDPATRRQVFVEINSYALGGDRVVAPEDPVQVDRAADVLLNADGNFVGARISDGLEEGSGYIVTSLVRQSTGPGRVTEADLAAAGVNYPAWARRYIDIRENSLGPVTARTAQRVVNRLPSHMRDPYHIAEAIQNYLYRDGGFQYRTDVRGMCTGEHVVDCFLSQKRGYCEYFATAMVMMLRTQQIPARYVLGYLPGKQQEEGGWLVDRSASHAWVEVYFPGYGWIRFDPTPGNRENGQTPTSLVPGTVDPAATPRPSATPTFGATPTPRRTDDGGAPPHGPDRLHRPARRRRGDQRARLRGAAQAGATGRAGARVCHCRAAGDALRARPGAVADGVRVRRPPG